MFRLTIAIAFIVSVASAQSPFTGTFRQIANSRTNANQLWAMTDTAVYRSDDQGKFYRGIRLVPNGPQPRLAQLHVDHRDSNRVFALTSERDPRLFRTSDAGATWAVVGEGLPKSVLMSTLPRYSIHQPLSQPESLYVRIEGRVYKSTDNGSSFTTQSILPVADGTFALAPSNPRVMYAASTGVTSGLAYSNDEGATWTRAGNLSQGSLSLGIISAGASVLVNPRNENQLFGYFFVTLSDPNSTNGRSATSLFYTSSDGGRTWNMAITSAGFVQDMTVSLDGALLLINGMNGFRSTDFGATLTRQDTLVRSFINSADSTRVINERGQISTDAGRTFAANVSTYRPFPGDLEPVRLTLETGTSLEVSTSPRDTEGKFLTYESGQVRASQPWIRVLPDPVTNTFSYSVQAHQLTAGEYEGTVEVTSPSLPEPIRQLVQLRVRDRVEPELRYRFRRIAGNGTRVFSGDGGPALQATFESSINTLALDSGNLIVGTPRRLRRINQFNTIQTITGGPEGRNGAGDGGPALQARFQEIGSLLPVSGSLYVVDVSDNRIRLIGTDGNISTFHNSSSGATRVSFRSRLRRNAAGDLFLSNSSGVLRWDGTQFRTALPANFSPFGMDFNIAAQGDLLIADERRIWRQRPVIPGTPAEPQRLIAGSTTVFFSGDHGPATAAQFNSIQAIAEDAEGNIFVLEDKRLRVIRPSGIVQTVAGNGDAGIGLKDGDLANTAGMGLGLSMAIDGQGRIYIGTWEGVVYVLERSTGVAPRIATGGVVSLAAGSPRIAPGAIFSIYGAELAGATEANSRVPLATSLSGVQVLVNGAPVGLFFVSAGQVNAQMPWNIAPGTARIAISRAGVNSAEQTVSIVATQPDILVYGANRAVAVNANGSINGEASGATPEEAIVVYLTGIGAVDQPVAAGAASPTNPLARAVATSSATIGGQNAQILYLGLAPGFVGLAQANLLVPSGLTAGDHPLSIRIGNGVSNQPLIRVRLP